AVGKGPGALVSAGGSLWVANEFDDAIASIDPDTNGIDRTGPFGGASASLASGEDGLGLAVGASASEHRGGTLKVSIDDPAPTSVDPAVVYDNEGWRILTITNDGTLRY